MLDNPLSFVRVNLGGLSVDQSGWLDRGLRQSSSISLLAFFGSSAVHGSKPVGYRRYQTIAFI